MKIVRLEGNKVREIIPDYALPVETWYGPAFAAECMEAPDDVEQGWIYDFQTMKFSEPPPSEPEPHTPDPEPEPAPEEAVTWASMATSIKEGVDDV